MNIWVGVLITPKSELTMSLGCCMCVWVCVFHFLLGGGVGGGRYFASLWAVSWIKKCHLPKVTSDVMDDNSYCSTEANPS